MNFTFSKFDETISLFAEGSHKKTFAKDGKTYMIYVFAIDFNEYLNRPAYLYPTKVDSTYSDGHAAVVLHYDFRVAKPAMESVFISAMQFRRSLKSGNLAVKAREGQPLLKLYEDTLRLHPTASVYNG